MTRSIEAATQGRDPIYADEVRGCDVLVVGGGVAGLSAALGSAARSVTLLTKTAFGAGGSSRWAQGGIAAAVGQDDSPQLHGADTLAVGGGLADPAAVDILTREGPARIASLIALGARFDRVDRGAEAPLALGREAAHSRRRILHAGGDATGAELVRTLIGAVRSDPRIRVAEHTFALDLVVEKGRVFGVLAVEGGRAGEPYRRIFYRSAAVVLATGGCGQLYRWTTNPPEVTGDGLAMSARAGAELVDLEMVQFHPTALAARQDHPTAPLPLLTEALRGEGAVLIDGAGHRFMVDEHELAELAPRDIVARAIARRSAAGGEVFLDAREAVGERFPERFPTAFEACRRFGIDPRRQPMPVVPAAHYSMGGVAVDARGRTSLPGLWACGEVASTGVHGANRLASNSLLEGLVFGARVAADAKPRPMAMPRLAVRKTASRPPTEDATAQRAELRNLAWRHLGLERSAEGLQAVQRRYRRLAEELPAIEESTFAALESRNLVAVGLGVARAAERRRESRGAHFRRDFPAVDPAFAYRLRWRGEEVIDARSGGRVREGAAGE
ncbi:MAG: L-aspartate oxidase [Acidobacteriota bacterium]